MADYGARRGERGSALLIVFVFAAIVLIMLYREIPIATFEAQRQKEQLTIDRGHEYQRAVQLYYRKFRGQYPASLEQLENTNGMRFLRRRYKDPLTGKDDWRLLKAGVGGVLTNSNLTQQNGLNPNGVGANANTNGTGGAGTPAPPSGNSDSSDTTSAASLDGSNGSNGAWLKHSPPAIQSSGGDSTAGGVPTSSELDQDPSKPLLPPAGQTADAASNAASATPQAPGTNGQGTNGPGSGGLQQTNLMQSVANNLGSAQPNFGGLAGNALSSGGIAGVGSNAKGRSIKRVNDQEEYSKWEFYYDPSKDTGMGSQNGMQGLQQQNQTGFGGLNPGGTQPTNQNQQQPATGFGGSSPEPANPPPPSQ